MKEESLQLFLLERWLMWCLQPSPYNTKRVKAYELYEFYLKYLRAYRLTGVVEYLGKPVTIRKFYNLIRDFIKIDCIGSEMDPFHMDFCKGRGGWYITNAIINPEVEQSSKFYEFLIFDFENMLNYGVPIPQDFVTWFNALDKLFPVIELDQMTSIPPHWVACCERLYQMNAYEAFTFKKEQKLKGGIVFHMNEAGDGGDVLIDLENYNI